MMRSLPWGASQSELARAMADAAAKAHESPEAALYARRVHFLARCAESVLPAIWRGLRPLDISADAVEPKHAALKRAKP